VKVGGIMCLKSMVSQSEHIRKWRRW
jgi:hypothetical protein